MSFKEVWSQIQMKKGLACLAYSQKYITLYKSTLEERKRDFFIFYIIIFDAFYY